MPREKMSSVTEQDVALMLQVGAGNEGALAELIKRWKNPLINFFYRSLGSFELAEDLTQTVFIQLYKAAPRYSPRARFSTFVFLIARRTLINEYRRQQRKPLELLDPSKIDIGSSKQNDLNLAEIEEILSYALKGLPEKQRTAILLLKQQELSYREIAEIMGASESAVKTWIFRARKHLKSMLKDYL